MKVYDRYSNIAECIEDILHRRQPDTNIRYFCPVCGENEGKLELIYDTSITAVKGRCWRASCDTRVFRQLQGMEWVRAVSRETLSNSKASKFYDTSLPRDYIPAQMPKSYYQWLQAHYITDEVIKDAGIGWSQERERLIFPSIADGVEGYCARSNTTKPKWVNKLTLQAYPSLNRRMEGTLVLVEDPISALRIGEVCDAGCVAGTKPAKKVLDFLNVEWYDQVILWLDSDIAGMSGVHTTLSNWRVWFRKTPVHVIFTDLDPKRYDKEFLQEKIRCFS